LTELVRGSGQSFITVTDFAVWGDPSLSEGANVFDVARWNYCV
jgi:hypothetical protein